MAKVNVYIDGFNLYYGAVKGSPYKWLDLGALCHRMLPNDTVQSIEYFTGELEGGNPRCSCGSIMKREYSPPVFRYLEFLRVAERAATCPVRRED